MGMAQRNRQRIRGVNLRLGGELEQMHDHHHDLLFVRPTRARDRLFDLRGGVLGNFKLSSPPATMAAPVPVPALTQSQRCAP